MKSLLRKLTKLSAWGLTIILLRNYHFLVYQIVPDKITPVDIQLETRFDARPADYSVTELTRFMTPIEKRHDRKRYKILKQ